MINKYIEKQPSLIEAVQWTGNNFEEVDEYFKQDIYAFKDTYVGRVYLSDLGIYENNKVEE